MPIQILRLTFSFLDVSSSPFSDLNQHDDDDDDFPQSPPLSSSSTSFTRTPPLIIPKVHQQLCFKNTKILMKILRMLILVSSRKLFFGVVPYLLEDAAVSRNPFFDRFAQSEKDKNKPMKWRSSSYFVGDQTRKIFITITQKEFEILVKFCDSIHFLNHLHIPRTTIEILDHLSSPRLQPRLQTLCLPFSISSSSSQQPQQGSSTSFNQNNKNNKALILQQKVWPRLISFLKIEVRPGIKLGYSLRALDLQGCSDFGSAELLEICEQHLSISSLEYLNLDGASTRKDLDDACLEKVVRKFGRRLTYLNLSGTGVGVRTLAAIGECCTSSLRVLKLSSARLDDKNDEEKSMNGAKIVGEMLRAFDRNPECRLNELDLTTVSFLNEDSFRLSVSSNKDQQQQQPHPHHYLLESLARLDLANASGFQYHRIPRRSATRAQLSHGTLNLACVAAFFDPGSASSYDHENEEEGNGMNSSNSCHELVALQHLDIGTLKAFDNPSLPSNLSSLRGCFQSIIYCCPRLRHLDLYSVEDLDDSIISFFCSSACSLKETLEEIDLSMNFSISKYSLVRVAESFVNLRVIILGLGSRPEEGFFSALTKTNLETKEKRKSPATIIERLNIGNVSDPISKQVLFELCRACSSSLRSLSIVPSQWTHDERVDFVEEVAKSFPLINVSMRGKH